MGECLILKSGSGVDTSNTTASESTILSGYTAYVDDEKVTGSIINRGSVTSFLNPGGSYTVLGGWYDGTGKVSVSSLSSNTPGTAQNGWILSGYNAWVNGNWLTGSMTNRGNQSWNLAANGTQIIWSGFYDGAGKVKQSLTTSGGGTWTPTTSNKTLVNTSTWVSGAWYVAGASTLIPANIKKGVTIFGVTGTWTGYVIGEMVLYEKGTFYTTYGLFTDYDGWGWYTLGASSIDISVNYTSRAFVELMLRVPNIKGAIDFTISVDSGADTLWKRISWFELRNTSLGFTEGNFLNAPGSSESYCNGDFRAYNYTNGITYSYLDITFPFKRKDASCRIFKIKYAPE